MSDIMSISRLRMGTDGKGITTLVGFHGCPLDCRFCINKCCHDNSDTVRVDYTAEELVELLKKDEPYFIMTGGGVTFGGGEPLLQSDFIHEVCKLVGSDWNKNIETSLYADWENILLLVDIIDYWYIDIKAVNNEIYESYTGKSNALALDNLQKLLTIVPSEKVCIRIPVIPDYKTVEICKQEAEFVKNEFKFDGDIDIFEYIKL